MNARVRHIRYLTAGAGSGSDAAMRRSRGSFNVQLAFVGARSYDISVVHVTVLDSNDAVLLDVRVGPRMYLDLPRGRYVIRATCRGVTRICSVTIQEAANIVSLEWPCELLRTSGMLHAVAG